MLARPAPRIARIGLCLGAAAMLAAAGGDAPSGAAPSLRAGSPPPESSRPYASLPHLGPAPQRCFDYGSSDNICSGPSWPYPPNANYLYATYYGTVYISPHVVGVGQDVTATAATDNGGTPSWGTPPGPIVSGCRDQETDAAGKVTRAADATCVWKATIASAYPPDADAVGHGWGQWNMSFCGFNGCAMSGDFYYVLPKKRAVSGTVTVSSLATNGDVKVEPASDAGIDISGANDQGTAVTDATGFYTALVDPGRYKVSVASLGSKKPAAHSVTCAPGSAVNAACIIDVSGEDGDADFAICGEPDENGADTSMTAGVERRESEAAPGAKACPLLTVWKYRVYDDTNEIVLSYTPKTHATKLFWGSRLTCPNTGGKLPVEQQLIGHLPSPNEPGVPVTVTPTSISAPPDGPVTLTFSSSNPDIDLTIVLAPDGVHINASGSYTSTSGCYPKL